jgi:hypothetical protein
MNEQDGSMIGYMEVDGMDKKGLEELKSRLGGYQSIDDVAALRELIDATIAEQSRPSTDEIERAIESLKYILKEDGCLGNRGRASINLAIQALRHQQVNGWISVSERLPKEKDETDGGEDVLIAVKYKYDLHNEPRTICCGYLTDGDWWTYREHDCGEIWEGDIVTHWMPLPSPPKGE